MQGGIASFIFSLDIRPWGRTLKFILGFYPEYLLDELILMLHEMLGFNPLNLF
jgi:hypothetical protein